MDSLNELTEFWLERVSESSEPLTSPPPYSEAVNEEDITKLFLSANNKALTLTEADLTTDIELIFKDPESFFCESNNSSAQSTPRTSPTPESIEIHSNRHKRKKNRTTLPNKEAKKVIDFTGWKFITCKEQFPPPTQIKHYTTQRAELVFFIIIESSLLLPGITLNALDLLEALAAFGVKIKSVDTVKQSTLAPLAEAQLIEDLIDGKVILKPDFLEKLCNIKSNDSNLQQPSWYIYKDGWARAANKITTLYPHSELAKKIAQHPILGPKNTKEMPNGSEEHQENSILEQYDNITLKNSNANSVSIVIAALKNSSEPPPKFLPSVSNEGRQVSSQCSFFYQQEITARLCNFLQTCPDIDIYLHKTTKIDEQIFYYILAIFFLVENHLIVRYGKKAFELSKSFINRRCEEQFQYITDQLDSIINASLALLCDYGILIFNKLSVDSYQLQENYSRFFPNIPGHAPRFNKNVLNAAGLKRIICSEYETLKDEPSFNSQITNLNFNN